MLREKQRPLGNEETFINPMLSAPAAPTLVVAAAPQQQQQQQQHALSDPMQVNDEDVPAVGSSAGIASPPLIAPLPPINAAPSCSKRRLETFESQQPSQPPPPRALSSDGVDVGVGRLRSAKSQTTSSTAAAATAAAPGGRSDSLDLSISCLEGSTMRIPIGGKTVPFRVVRRRGRGISSVVFECEHEVPLVPKAEDAGVPRIVTVKVMSGGESGMGQCLREVETLAFLKIKRKEAGLARARVAELASWFYRRSAIGGVDHVCLVFRGGGISLREAMAARSPANAVAGRQQQQQQQQQQQLRAAGSWKPSEVVEVARGLLEGIAFLHSVGLIHADIKPENVALYPPSPPASIPGTTPDATTTTSTTTNGDSGGPQPTAVHVGGAPPTGDGSLSAPFDLRLIDLGNSVFAADAVPGVTAGTPSYLSPEAQRGLPWGPKVDVWAVGFILFEIMTGARVARGGDGGGGGGGGVGTGVALGDGGGMMGLVSRLLAEVDARPTAAEALKDPCFFL